MTPEQAAAFINSQAASAMCELEGMKAENKAREMRGLSPAYSENQFFELIDQYGISHNAVLELFQHHNGQ